jgi:hypothetical protein
MARGSHLLGLSLSGSKVHHQDPLHLECVLLPQRHVQLNRDSGMLASELASLWRYLLLDGGLPSVSLRLLPSVMSVTLLLKEVGFYSWRRWPRGDRHHGLNSRSILHPSCG